MNWTGSLRGRSVTLHDGTAVPHELFPVILRKVRTAAERLAPAAKRSMLVLGHEDVLRVGRVVASAAVDWHSGAREHIEKPSKHSVQIEQSLELRVLQLVARLYR